MKVESNIMELRSRSSRSRSKTPTSFQQSGYQEDYVTQSIRITRSKVKSYEESSSSQTILSPTQESMEKTVLKKRFVTSDYSSDDGENEVSSSLQNFKNQTIENTSTTKVNGELSALKIYRQAGEYWNKYPKTDYTYSQHSKDRVEISPGVIQMPNMSRKSIRNSPITNTSPNVQFIANKACSTDSFLGNTSIIHDYSTETVLRPRNLFTTPRQGTNSNTVNGNEHRLHYSASSSTRYSHHIESTNVVVSIWRYFLTWTYFLYEVQSQSTMWAMKRFYRFTCWILLMDRWLLTRTSQRISSMTDADDRNDGKMKKLLLLCGIPLLLLGGWFFLWGLAGIISNRPVAVDKILVIEDMPSNIPNILQNSVRLSASEITTTFTQEQLVIISELIRNIISTGQHEDNELTEKLLRDPNFISIITERLKENINLEMLSAVKTAGSLNTDDVKEQTEKLNAYSEDDIVGKLLQNPVFLNMENTVRNQDIFIKELQERIESLGLGLAADSNAEFRRFEHQLKRCCRNSFIAMEKYVLDIIRDIFQAPKNLDHAHFSRWLKTVFVARDDLENRLGNLTANLNDKYDTMVKDSGQLLMDQVAQKLREQTFLDRDNSASDYDSMMAKNSERPITQVTHEEEYVKKIVRDVLAKYDADKTGLVDYALETSGAEVLSTKCTEPYHHSTAVWSVLGVPLWHMYNAPHTVLQPSVNPGECWAFQSFPGYMLIKLSHRIHIEAISYEHVNKLLIPNSRIDSAPKKFSVYGVADPDDNKNEPLLLGEFVYDASGEPLQFFIIPGNETGETPAFSIIELRVNTNHGNPNYTCLYRLRVHGKLAIDNPT